eukprot:scaffold18382_cov57-Attheya_sp.AAC.6
MALLLLWHERHYFCFPSLFVHSRNQKKCFYKALSHMMRRRRSDQRIPQVALQDPHVSAVQWLYASENDQAMITLTGLDNATLFEWLKGPSYMITTNK